MSAQVYDTPEGAGTFVQVADKLAQADGRFVPAGDRLAPADCTDSMLAHCKHLKTQMLRRKQN
jgi:hypothetical protein